MINIAFKIIALLCLSIFLFFCSSNEQKITVFLRPESYVGCPDTLVVKNIDLSVKKKNMLEKGEGMGRCMDGTIYGKLVAGVDTLLFDCLPIKKLYLKEGKQFYETTVDTLSLRMLNDIIKSFKPSKYCPNFKIAYLRPESMIGCSDTLDVMSLDLSFKKSNKFDYPVGWLGTIYGKLARVADTLFFDSFPIRKLYLKEGEEFYETIVEAFTLQKLSDNIDGFIDAVFMSRPILTKKYCLDSSYIELLRPRWFSHLQETRDSLIEKGNILVEKIEKFRTMHDRLPVSLKEIDVEKEYGGASWFYRANQCDYTLTFGMLFDEGMIYHSDTKTWESSYRNMRPQSVDSCANKKFDPLKYWY